MNIKPEKIAIITKAVVASAHLIVAIGRAIARPLADDALDNVTAKATEFTTAVADVAAEMED